MNGFTAIVITNPEPTFGEETAITMLLESGAADFVHLRKPDACYQDFRHMIETIPARLHPRLKIHSHFSLLGEFCLGGAHLNSRHPARPENSEYTSRSCHSVAELSDNSDVFCYQTLSPVFDSISKQNYHSRFNAAELKGKISDLNVIALGGVMPQHLRDLKRAGFIGAAMLGYVWQNISRLYNLIDEIITNKELCCNT